MSGSDWKDRFRLDDAFLEQYELVGEIGRGAMGVVLQARQRSIGRMVAVKFLLPQFYEDRESLRRFRAEASILARLNHPNVVQVLTFEDRSESPYLVLEYVAGKSLGKLLQANGPMPAWSALKVMEQVLLGLEQAHQAQVIHRDLKSENILVTEGGVPKIVDFGLAKLTEGRGNQTDSGVILGTPEYMSPEQVRGDDLDGRSDLYSAGIILFEMLTGVVPFRSPAVTQILLDQLETPPPLLREVVSGLPPELDELVRKALAKDRFSRYRSAEAFRLAIQGTGRALQRQKLLGARASGVQQGRTLAAGERQEVLHKARDRGTRREPTGGLPQRIPGHREPSRAEAVEAPRSSSWKLFLGLTLLFLALGAGQLVYQSTLGARRSEAEVRAEVEREQKEAEVEATLEAFFAEADPTQALFLARSLVKRLEDPSAAPRAVQALEEVFEGASDDTLLVVVGEPLARRGRVPVISRLLELWGRLDSGPRASLLDALEEGLTRARGGRRFVAPLEDAVGLCEAAATVLSEPFRGRYPSEERVRLIRVYACGARNQDLQEGMLAFATRQRFGRPEFASREEIRQIGHLGRDPKLESLRKKLERTFLHKRNKERIELPEDLMAALEEGLGR